MEENIASELRSGTYQSEDAYLEADALKAYVSSIKQGHSTTTTVNWSVIDALVNALMSWIDRHGLDSIRDLKECQRGMESMRMQSDAEIRRLSKLVTEYQVQMAEHETQRVSYMKSRKVFQNMLQDAHLEMKRASFAQRQLDCSDLLIQEKNEEYQRLCAEVAQQTQALDAMRKEKDHYARIADEQSLKLRELNSLRLELKESKQAFHELTSHYEEALSLNSYRMMEMEDQLSELSSSPSKLTPPPEESPLSPLGGPMPMGTDTIIKVMRNPNPITSRRRSSIAMIEPMENMEFEFASHFSNHCDYSNPNGVSMDSMDSIDTVDSNGGYGNDSLWMSTQPLVPLVGLSSPETVDRFDTIEEEEEEEEEEGVDTASVVATNELTRLLMVEEDDEFEIESTIRIMASLDELRQKVKDRVYDRFLLEVSSSDHVLRKLCRQNGWKLAWFVTMMQQIQMLFVDAQMMVDHEHLFPEHKWNGNAILDFITNQRVNTKSALEMARNIVQFEALYGDGFNFAMDFVTALMEYFRPRMAGIFRERAVETRFDASLPVVQCLVKEWYLHLVALMANRFCGRVMTEIVSLKLLSVQSHDKFLDILCAMVIRHPVTANKSSGTGRKKRDTELMREALEGVSDANIRNHVTSYFMKVSALSAADVYRIKKGEKKKKERKSSTSKSMWKYLYDCESSLF